MDQDGAQEGYCKRPIPCRCRCAKMEAERGRGQAIGGPRAKGPGTGRMTRAKTPRPSRAFQVPAASNKERAKSDEVTSVVVVRPGCFYFEARAFGSVAALVRPGTQGAASTILQILRTINTNQTTHMANLSRLLAWGLPPPFGHFARSKARIGNTALASLSLPTAAAPLHLLIVRHHLALTLYCALTGPFSCASHIFIAVFLPTPRLQHAIVCTMTYRAREHKSDAEAPVPPSRAAHASNSLIANLSGESVMRLRLPAVAVQTLDGAKGYRNRPFRSLRRSKLSRSSLSKVLREQACIRLIDSSASLHRAL